MYDAHFAELLKMQAKTVRDLCQQNLRPDRPAVAYADRVGSTIENLLKMYEPARAVYEDVWKKLELQELDDEEGTGTILQHMLDGIAEEFAEVEAIIGTDRPEYRCVEEFFEAGRSIRRMKDELASQWPWISHEQIKASQQAHDAGRWQEVGEILRELESPRP